MSTILSSTYQAKDFTNILGMEGFSGELLNTHFKLYQGYVTNTNDKLERLNRLLSEGKDRSAEYQEIRRRLGWEFNGMRLHEYYFSNLGGKKPINQNGRFYKKIAEDFGSFENWKKDFVSTGMMRGIGWAALYQDPTNDRLINMWIEEHNTNHFPNGNLILIMDVFEHAFMKDYGTDREKYIDSFFRNINWEEVEKRYSK